MGQAVIKMVQSSRFNACPELAERDQGWEIEPETLYPKH